MVIKNRKTIYSVLLVVFLLGATAYFSFKAWEEYTEVKRKQRGLERQRIIWKALEEDIKKQLSNFSGTAGIVIKDLGTGRQILINTDEPFASASLVKIPIMLACFYAANEGKISLDEKLTLKATDRVPGLGTLKYAPAGAKFTVEKLIELMIVESDNTAANVLIDRLGFAYLNNCFKKLGLKNTNISRKIMDFKERKEGRENFTTSSDTAFLLEGVYNHRLINETYSRMGLELLKNQKIRDRIPAKLPVSIVVAHKTGLENGVCHDAGIVFTSRGDLLICILTKHKNKTARPAKEFIAQIALLAHNYYQSF